MVDQPVQLDPQEYVDRAAFPYLNVEAKWRQVTNAPLSGMDFALEAGKLLAWDQASNVYILDLNGKNLLATRSPSPLQFGRISDDGSQIVVTERQGKIWWVDSQLAPRLSRKPHGQLVGQTISSCGRYLASSSADYHTLIHDMYGRRITNLTTNRPLQFLHFVTDRSTLVGVSEYGLAGSYQFDGSVLWQDALWSSVGDIAVSGNGLAILVACFTHGLQRYGADGTNEGAYHLGGGIARVATDFDGRFIAASTLEGELLLLNAAGQIVWRSQLDSAVVSLFVDAASGFMIVGQESGQIMMLEFTGSSEPTPPLKLTVPATAIGSDTVAPRLVDSNGAEELQESSDQVAVSYGAPIRSPDWTLRLFENEDQASTAVLAVTQSPARVGVYSNDRIATVFNESGELKYKSEQLGGIGRQLVTSSSHLIATSDRKLILIDLVDFSAIHFDPTFYNITHSLLDEPAGQLIIVEDRDEIARFDLKGRHVWHNKLKETYIEHVGIGRDSVGITTEDGQLIVIDAAGQRSGHFASESDQPLSLASWQRGWLTVQPDPGILRCHDTSGEVLWQVQTPAGASGLSRFGSHIVVNTLKGQIVQYDSKGIVQMDSSEVPSDARLFELAGQPAALFWNSGNVMVTDLQGRVWWRHVSSEMPGAMVASSGGLACSFGCSLSFFSHHRSNPDE